MGQCLGSQCWLHERETRLGALYWRENFLFGPLRFPN